MSFSTKRFLRKMSHALQRQRIVVSGFGVVFVLVMFSAFFLMNDKQSIHLTTAVLAPESIGIGQGVAACWGSTGAYCSATNQISYTIALHECAHYAGTYDLYLQIPGPINVATAFGLACDGATTLTFNAVPPGEYYLYIVGSDGQFHDVVDSTYMYAEHFTGPGNNCAPTPLTGWTTYCTGSGNANPANDWQYWQYSDWTDGRHWQYYAPGDASCAPPTPPPPAPSTITPNCSPDGTTVTLTWTDMSSAGATGYYPRLQNPLGFPTCANPWWSLWSDGQTCYANDVGANSYSHTITPGTTYYAWVHSGGVGGVNWGANAATGAFSCPAAAVDLCPNIAGTQATVPSGMVVDGAGQCVAAAPVCAPSSGSACTVTSICGGAAAGTFDCAGECKRNDGLLRDTDCPPLTVTNSITCASNVPRLHFTQNNATQCYINGDDGSGPFAILNDYYTPGDGYNGKDIYRDVSLAPADYTLECVNQYKGLAYNPTLDKKTLSYSAANVAAACSAPSSPPPPSVTCPLPWGGTIAEGASVTAYQSASAAPCVSETRTCQSSGSLSGSYTNQTCTPPPTATLEVKKKVGGTWSSSNLTIDQGEEIELQWDSTNATVGCNSGGFRIDNIGQGSNPTSGIQPNVTEPVNPGDASTYMISCTNGAAADAKTITVTKKASASIWAEPARVRLGGTSTIKGKDAITGCAVTANDPAQATYSISAPGDFSFSRVINGQTTFTLTCPTAAPTTTTVRIIPKTEEI